MGSEILVYGIGAIVAGVVNTKAEMSVYGIGAIVSGTVHTEAEHYSRGTVAKWLTLSHERW